MFIRESDNNGRKYLSIAKKIKRPDGKGVVKVIAGLGYTDDLEKVYKDPKKFFKRVLKKLEEQDGECEPDQEIPLKSSDSHKNLGYGYIKWVLLELKIDQFFKNKQQGLDISYNLFEIYAMLVYSQIIHPSSVEMSFFRACEFFEKIDYELYDVYRALDFFADYCDELQVFIYKKLNLMDDGDLKELFFDGTNVYFEIDREDPDVFDENGELVQTGLRKKGFSKENRPLPILNFGIINNDQGLPVAFNVFNGKGHEKTYLIPLLDFIKNDYDLKNFEIIADRDCIRGKSSKRSKTTTVAIREIPNITSSGWAFGRLRTI